MLKSASDDERSETLSSALSEERSLKNDTQFQNPKLFLVRLF